MLEEKIMQDYIKAMKEKDTVKTSTLSFLRAELKNIAIDKKKDKLDDNDIIPIIKKQIKRRQDSIEQFKQGNRIDLVEKEEKELVVLKSYLPEELSEEAVKKVVEDIIKSSGASSIKDMGKIMKEALSQLAGKADSSLVSRLVKEKLS
ncbi:MAG: GatB/YqeY domain-containing protein [Candidatus Omnitrophota bacterium]